MDQRRKVSKSRAKYTDGFFSSDFSSDSQRSRNVVEIEFDTGPFGSPCSPQVEPKDIELERQESDERPQVRNLSPFSPRSESGPKIDNSK